MFNSIMRVVLSLAFIAVYWIFGFNNPVASDMILGVLGSFVLGTICFWAAGKFFPTER